MATGVILALLYLNQVDPYVLGMEAGFNRAAQNGIPVIICYKVPVPEGNWYAFYRSSSILETIAVYRYCAFQRRHVFIGWASNTEEITTLLSQRRK